MSADVTVEIKGLAELQRTLSLFPGKLQERIGVKATSAAAEVIQKEIKARAPVRAQGGRAMKIGKGKNSGLRYPGNLRKYIRRRRVSRGSGTTISYVIGPAKRAWYARLVEKGTRYAAAHPFMRPALDAKGMDAIEKFRLTLAEGLDEAVKASR